MYWQIGNELHVEMQIDTGTRTIVHQKLLDNVSVKQKTLQTTTANEEVMEYSLADYELKWDRKSYQLEVAVVKVLPIPVLLGNDVLLIEITLKSRS